MREFAYLSRKIEPWRDMSFASIAHRIRNSILVLRRPDWQLIPHPMINDQSFQRPKDANDP